MKYYEHRFDFDLNQFNNDELFLHMDSKKFKNAGIRAFYQFDKDETRKITLAGGAEFKSDHFEWSINTTKYFFSALHRWKLSDRKNITAGAVLNYDLGRFNAYPVLIYQNDLNKSWNLELSLPKSVAIRRRINASNFLIFKSQFKGWRYNLTNAIQDQNTDLTIRRADLLTTITWEHEIHDWLWFGVDAGYIHNLRHFLVDPGGSRRDALVNISSQDAHYFKLSLFLVPPRKFYH